MQAKNYKAKIYKLEKNPMQSGLGNSKKWKLEFEHDGSRMIDNITGWTSSSDMMQEVSLLFDTKEQAIYFAKKNQFEYIILEPNIRTIKPKSYASNFKYTVPEIKE